MNDLSAFALHDFKDDSWILKYIAQMGHEKLFEYRNNVAKQLNSLKVGQIFRIADWVKPENYDLFIKTACCYIVENKGCYLFYENYTIIKHVFDAQEVEKTLRIFGKQCS